MDSTHRLTVLLLWKC